MKQKLTLVLMLAIALWGTNGLAQHGRGKPATTGLEHAETKANPHGQKGIENAEAKQAEHKSDKKDKKDKVKKQKKGKNKSTEPAGLGRSNKK